MFDLFFKENGLFLLLAFVAFIQLCIWLIPLPKGRSGKDGLLPAKLYIEKL